MSRLLLVEDSSDIADSLARAFQHEGYDTVCVETGGEAIEAAADGVDLVILDLGLPDMDGLEVCRRIRSGDPKIPILMLTGRTGEIDAVIGLDEGADDYLAKPVRLAELQARVRALLRRRADQGVHAEGLRIDPASRRAWMNDEELELTRKEFDLLALLEKEAGTVVTRERIMAEVWNTDWLGTTKTLDMHISSLRRKLGDDPAEPKLLTTVRGVGYRLEGK